MIYSDVLSWQDTWDQSVFADNIVLSCAVLKANLTLTKWTGMETNFRYPSRCFT